MGRVFEYRKARKMMNIGEWVAAGRCTSGANLPLARELSPRSQLQQLESGGFDDAWLWIEEAGLPAD